MTVLNNLLAIAFALASAIVIAWGTVVRHEIALGASSDVLLTAIRRPLWWAGTLTAVLGYGLQVVALGFGTLLIVQPILVLSLMFTLPLSAWYSGRRMSRREVAWSLLLTVAVAVLVVLGRPSHGLTHPSLHSWIPALAVGIVVLAALIIIAYTGRVNRALFLGTACGFLYGYVAVFSKAVVDILNSQGLVTLLGSWQFYALVLSAGAGTILQQYSFHAGPLTFSLPAMTIVEPIVAFTLGYAVLKEEFAVESLLGWSVMVLALLAMIAATIALSRSREA